MSEQRTFGQWMELILFAIDGVLKHTGNQARMVKAEVISESLILISYDGLLINEIKTTKLLEEKVAVGAYVQIIGSEIAIIRK